VQRGDDIVTGRQRTRHRCLRCSYCYALKSLLVAALSPAALRPRRMFCVVRNTSHVVCDGCASVFVRAFAAASRGCLRRALARGAAAPRHFIARHVFLHHRGVAGCTSRLSCAACAHRRCCTVYATLHRTSAAAQLYQAEERFALTRGASQRLTLSALLCLPAAAHHASG